jgi:hypothetical protein
MVVMTRARYLGVLVIVSVASCGGEGRDLTAYREAVATSRVGIAGMADVAEASMSGGRTVTAELRLGTVPTYSFGTIGDSTLHDIRIDTVDGRIVSSIAAGASTDGCPGSISIAQAITIAEGRVAGGSVIAAIPDDDVACAREIQVLAPDLLWEVKVGGAGEVLEVEESDETED